MDYQKLREFYIQALPQERLAHVQQESVGWDDKNIEQVLKMACQQGFENVADFLFDKAPHYVQQGALAWAVTSGHTQLVRNLMQHKDGPQHAQDVIGHDLKDTDMVSILLPHCKNLKYDMCSLLKNTIKHGTMQTIEQVLMFYPDPQDRLYGALQAIILDNANSDEVVRQCFPIADNKHFNVWSVVWDAHNTHRYSLIDDIMPFCGPIDEHYHSRDEIQLFKDLKHQHETKQLNQAITEQLSNRPDALKKKM